jgi:hypothetical protein
MRKNLLIGTAVAFLAGAAGWGWFMMSHPQSVHAIANGWKHVWHRHDTRACPNEPAPAQTLIEIEPLTVTGKVGVPESTDPVEVIDLTQLQRVPQPPMETVEPPLATEVPAVFRELPSSEPAVKPATHDEPSEPLPPELSQQLIPADFLLHSADCSSASPTLSWMLSPFQGQRHTRNADHGLGYSPSKVQGLGCDHVYHRQHPGCPYLAGSSLDRVPELLPEPSLLPEVPRPGKKSSKRDTLEILPGEVPSFWPVTPF